MTSLICSVPSSLVGAGLKLTDGEDDRLRLADGAEVRPGRADLAGVEQRGANSPERRDVAILVRGPARLGEVAERSGLDQRQVEVEPSPEEQGVEHPPEVSQGGAVGGELVPAPGPGSPPRSDSPS